nr:integrase, catalytic region, zinc finger, CCHC-type, peptidase aspartic, catalytic [Tanacetum cinerariifolium]
MINSIQNGDQPLPVIAQVSLARNAHNAPPTLKDLKFWTVEEKKTRKIDRLARSFLIQGLSNDIYSLIDSNETAKDLWDALERKMCGSEYGEQDRKAAILYEYETFKAIEEEQLLDTYLRYLQEPISYDKHALWGVSYWGRKHQQFYGFAVNRESALDVYSKRRIIAVTELKIVEWHNYKHLDWISRRVEDLQLGVESYQKRLNLTKPDTYQSDLKRHEATDGTLNDVRNALDDRLKGIRMQYFPTTIWRRGDKDRAAAMIQAIDKMLKTRRIMRSLERFVGGRQYEGDFRLLQRTI